MKTFDAIRILLVDDSAVIRGALGRIIDRQSDMRVVTTAHSGRAALDALKHTHVDIVVLDIEMPELDGLSALPMILTQFPATRVIMASSLTQEGAEVTMQALALGAADFIPKPAAKHGSVALAALADEIAAKIRAVGHSVRSERTRTCPPSRPMRAKAETSTAVSLSRRDSGPRVVALASSTGGPNALAEVLAGLPPAFPLPILITQHMPPIFTGLLAQRLARDAGRPCVEATNGLAIQPGVTYVAPGDHHMIVQTEERRPFIRLTQTPPENYVRPAADPMLRSIATLYGSATLAVILTGMGEDGKRGCEEVSRRGGQVIVQDESTSVVWGMPGAVAMAGLANWVLSLRDISTKIGELCTMAAAS